MAENFENLFEGGEPFGFLCSCFVQQLQHSQPHSSPSNLLWISKGQANFVLYPLFQKVSKFIKLLMAENFSDSIVAVIGKALKRIRGS